MNLKKRDKKSITTAIVVVSMLVGVIAGTTVFSAHQSDAQTTTATQAAPSPTTQAVTSPNPSSPMNNGAPSGTFKSNEDPAHEAQESPEREAQENAGQVPTVR